MRYLDQNFDSLKIKLQAKKRQELDAILENEEYEAAVKNESDLLCLKKMTKPRAMS